MNKEELFKEFLDEYLENVIKELPDSYRARQLREGGLPKEAVILFETKFLREPFEKAMGKVKE